MALQRLTPRVRWVSPVNAMPKPLEKVIAALATGDLWMGWWDGNIWRHACGGAFQAAVVWWARLPASPVLDPPYLPDREMTFKEWRMAEAERLGVSLSTLEKRLYGGIHPMPPVRRVNARVVFVPPREVAA